MIIISHRGNINGPDKELENNQPHIKTLLKTTPFHVEIDVWYDKSFTIGHDEPTDKLVMLMADSGRLLYHCKNKGCLEKLNEDWHAETIHYFWHEVDKYTITSQNKVIVYPGEKITKKSIVMLPEKHNYSIEELKLASAVCTDYPFKYWGLLCN